MRVVIKQEAKQIAVDARKVDLHVQTCVIVYYVKIMTVRWRIKITYLKKKLTISSYFSTLKFCCDYFIVKGYYLTIIKFHIVMALYFKIFKGSEIVISSAYFLEKTPLLALVLQTVFDLKMISINISVF